MVGIGEAVSGMTAVTAVQPGQIDTLRLDEQVRCMTSDEFAKQFKPAANAALSELCDKCDEHQWPVAAERTMPKARRSEYRRVGVGMWHTQLEVEGLVLHPAARQFLSEFGELAVRVDGLGKDFARTTINFDPILCTGQRGWLETLSDKTVGALFPLGEEVGDNCKIQRRGVIWLRAQPFQTALLDLVARSVKSRDQKPYDKDQPPKDASETGARRHLPRLPKHLSSPLAGFTDPRCSPALTQSPGQHDAGT